MNVFKKILKVGLIGLGILIGCLLIFLAISVAPIDRTGVKEFPEYAAMMSRLDSLKGDTIPQAQKKISVGYSKINLTPSFPTATAGYGKRRGKLFNTVRDSIYVRTLVVDNGTSRVAIVSADLLLIPPTVVKILQPKLQAIGFSLDNTYLGATHTHNSIGNWGEGATRVIYGAYDESVVTFIADCIIKSIEQASGNLLPSKLYAGKIPIGSAVENRLIDGGPEDSLLRVLEVHREDSSKLLFMSYTAHATCLFSADLSLSRDYPGKLVDLMETRGYAFTMFMAGSVASHACDSPVAGTDCMDWMANHIANEFSKAQGALKPLTDSVVWMKRVPLSLPDPQVKLTGQWKARSWLFRAAFGEYPAYLTALRIGELTMLGTPCDFSGEFDPAIDAKGKEYGINVMVTSFNGGYIGYVTPSRYYDVDHYETQLMNWYPPGNGEYITECLQKLMVSISNR